VSDLGGRAAIVCGSSRGIGRACAEELARRGATVFLVARDLQALRRVAAELPADQGQAHRACAADFSRPREVQTAVAGLVNTEGPVQILVNNTGGPPAGPLLDAAYEDLAAAMEMHLGCNQLLTRVVAPGMESSGYGRIINIISTSVLTPRSPTGPGRWPPSSGRRESR
jgi:3-oxoacyl-[acyl-carrier protein] reductase